MLDLVTAMRVQVAEKIPWHFDPLEASNMSMKV